MSLLVKIILRPGYSENNDFWYFKEVFRTQLYQVIDSENIEKYLVLSNSEEEKLYINKVDCQILSNN